MPAVTNARFMARSTTTRAVIVDEIKLDNWIVLDPELKLPLGRSTIAVYIDIATWTVLSQRVSFEPPSQSIEPVVKDFRRGDPDVAPRDAWTIEMNAGPG